MGTADSRLARAHLRSNHHRRGGLRCVEQQASKGVRIDRHFGGRFAVGAETEVRIEVANHTSRDLDLVLKDEYPPQMKLSGMREARLEVEAQTSASFIYSLTPPKRGQFAFGRIAVRYLSRWRLVVVSDHWRAIRSPLRFIRTCVARAKLN